MHAQVNTKLGGVNCILDGLATAHPWTARPFMVCGAAGLLRLMDPTGHGSITPFCNDVDTANSETPSVTEHLHLKGFEDCMMCAATLWSTRGLTMEMVEREHHVDAGT